MYVDPSHIRDHEVKVRFNDHELALLDALAKYNRRQRAAFVRELVLATVERIEHQQGSEQTAAA